MTTKNQDELFGTAPIGRILLKTAPPVMLAQLIQALYNIVDSFFVGKYSTDALTALTVIYPLQLIIIALAVGTGVGTNTYMARKYALNQPEKADAAAGTGMVLAVVMWAVLAIVSVCIMRPYVKTSASSPAAIDAAVTYGIIVSVGSLGSFLEGNWTKVHQAQGNMRLPMLAQITGALINIIFDPLLIFGIDSSRKWALPGQPLQRFSDRLPLQSLPESKAFETASPAETGTLRKKIYFYGYSSIFMQGLYTVYILALNIILAGFSDAAVTVLGLYYKLQSFFFIPLFGLQTCIVPVISFNLARRNYSRCKRTMNLSFLISALFMVLGVICFVFFPRQMVDVFSNSQEVHDIGAQAFPIIGASFLPAVFSLMMPVFFQAIGAGVQACSFRCYGRLSA